MMSEQNPATGLALPVLQPVARLHDVSLRYGRKTQALDGLSLDVPAGCMVGFIGPDGVGKSTYSHLVAGARAIQAGEIDVLGGDMADVATAGRSRRRSVVTGPWWFRLSPLARMSRSQSRRGT